MVEFRKTALRSNKPACEINVVLSSVMFKRLRFQELDNDGDGFSLFEPSNAIASSEVGLGSQ